MARYRYAHWPFTSIYASSTYLRRLACWCRLRRKCSANMRPIRSSHSRTISCVKENPRCKDISAKSFRLNLYRTRQRTTSNICPWALQEIERCFRALIKRPHAALTPEPQITQARGLGKHNWARKWATGKLISLHEQSKEALRNSEE